MQSQNDKKLRLEIEENKSMFFSGEMIKGKIIFLYENPPVISVVKLSLIMKEFWYHNSKQIEFKTEKTINTRSIELLNKFDSDFSFQIPYNLNSSFEFNSFNYNIYIRYFLIAELHSLEENHVNQKLIIIKSIGKYSPSNFIQFGSNINIMKFINLGNCLASVKLKQNNIKMGEFLELAVNVNNNSKYNIKEIKINLIRDIIFRNEKEFKERKIIGRKIFSWIVESGQEKQNNFLLKIEDSKLQNFDLRTFKNPYQNIEIQDLINSVSTNYIECKYSLKITFYFNHFVAFDQRPRIFLPINICHKYFDKEFSLDDQSFISKDSFFKNKNENISIINRDSVIESFDEDSLF